MRLQYTEFTAYAALLSGASPSVLERSLVAQHPQLWKLREYYLYAEDDEPDSAGECAMSVDARMPLSPGNPLRAYIPANTELRETAEGLEVLEPGRAPQRYESWARASKREGTRRVRDMILKGEVCRLYYGRVWLADCVYAGAFCVGAIQSAWASPTL